ASLAAFAAAEAGELEKALQRNIFAGADDARGAARLAHYVGATRRQFAAQDDGALRRGQVSFPHPDSIAEATIHA
ncbi:MAG: ubiquinol-cytochrome C chaperone family protein, partial [Xanthobacteraceae bacterium]